jgi:hypothetical protein
MTSMNEQIRWVAAVAIVYALAGVARFGSPVQAASAPLPGCEETCGPTASCGEACEYPAGESWVFTTCGEYNGGGSAYCDGNTCEDVCGPHAPAAWECWEDFQLSSCYDQNNHAVCGDDICAWYYGAESWANCSDDCGNEPPAVDCPNSICGPGESWMNCPADCPAPSGGTCPNGLCDEDPSTCPDDCDSPELSCKNWPCPTNYNCVNGQCIYANHNIQWCNRANTGCGSNAKCVFASSDDWFGFCLPSLW